MINTSPQSYKVHDLANELQLKGLLPDLDNDANKVLFKRNFLLMNALYQLQAILLPEQWLQVQAMDIQIFARLPKDIPLILKQDVALHDYYLDWGNFETSSESIASLLSHFWTRYSAHIGKPEHKVDKAKALQIFELDDNASKQVIRQQWQKLALKWHPDRATGNAEKFHEICWAWQKLRTE